MKKLIFILVILTNILFAEDLCLTKSSKQYIEKVLNWEIHDLKATAGMYSDAAKYDKGAYLDQGDGSCENRAAVMMEKVKSTLLSKPLCKDNLNEK